MPPQWIILNRFGIWNHCHNGWIFWPPSSQPQKKNGLLRTFTLWPTRQRSGHHRSSSGLRHRIIDREFNHRFDVMTQDSALPNTIIVGDGSINGQIWVRFKFNIKQSSYSVGRSPPDRFGPDNGAILYYQCTHPIKSLRRRLIPLRCYDKSIKNRYDFRVNDQSQYQEVVCEK